MTGLGNLSLRGLAKAIGVTPPTLLHHFGSKEGLITEVLDALEREQMAAVALLDGGEFSLEDFLRRLWERQTTADELSRIRLQFEAITLGATEAGLPGPIRAKVMRSWVEQIRRKLEAQGFDQAEARNRATLMHAAIVGLTIDLLATNDRERTDAASQELFRMARGVDRNAKERMRAQAAPPRAANAENPKS